MFYSTLVSFFCFSPLLDWWGIEEILAKMGMTEEFETSLQVLRGFDTDISVEVHEIKVFTSLFCGFMNLWQPSYMHEHDSKGMYKVQL